MLGRQEVIDLLDIIEPGGVIESVYVSGFEVPVRGMTNREYAMLLRRFPILDAAEPAPALPRADRLDADEDLKSAIIAIGLGFPGDEVVEAKVDRLWREERRLLSDTILRLTNPQSAGPLERGNGEARPLPSPEPENPGKAEGSASSSSSTNSSHTDTSAPT
jgi:hypothetical protein